MNFMIRFITILLFLSSLLPLLSQSNPPGIQSIKNWKSPLFYMGVYMNNQVALKPKDRDRIFNTIQELGMNSIVVDVQPKKLPMEFIDELTRRGIYGISRVVVFEQGLKTEFPDSKHMEQIYQSIRHACKIGFQEINLDYIRYSDGGWNFKASTEKRYENMKKIILDIKEKTSDTCSLSVKWSADIFGRVPFIENDPIGQKVEEYSKVVDALYPMLYPSHFYDMPHRQYNPYQTIWDGIQKTIQRSSTSTQVISWIQGFEYYTRGSGLSFQDYIQAQMQAALDAGGNGFIVWNAKNEYKPTWEAFQNFYQENHASLQNLKGRN